VTITKHIGRNHPYVASSFATQVALQGGRSGLLSGGAVSEASPFASPSTLTVAPFVIEINGLIISSSEALSPTYNRPSTQGKELFLTVSSPDDSSSSGLTWRVAGDLRDLQPTEVLFAIRVQGPDGTVAWISPPRGDRANQRHRDAVGWLSQWKRSGRIHTGGHDAYVDGDEFHASWGMASPDGAISDPFALELGPAHHSFDRRDRVVLRRSLASGDLAGAVAGDLADQDLPDLLVLTGVPEAPAASAQTSTKVSDGNAAPTTGRMAVIGMNKHRERRGGTYLAADGFNEAYVAWKDTSDNLRFRRMESDRSTLSATSVSAATDSTRADLSIGVLSDGSAVVVHTADPDADGWQKLYLSRVDSSGAWDLEDQLLLDGDTLVTGASIKRPAVAVDDEDRIHIVFELEMEPGGVSAWADAEALFWIRVTSSGDVVTSAARITDQGDLLSASNACRYASISWRPGELLVGFIRDDDIASALVGGDADYLTVDLSQTPPVSSSPVQMSAKNRVAERDPAAPEWFREPGSYQPSTVRGIAVADGGSRVDTAVVFSSEPAGLGNAYQYVAWGPDPVEPFMLEALAKNPHAAAGDETWAIRAEAEDHGPIPSSATWSWGRFPEVSADTDFHAVSDGVCIHLAAIDSNGEAVYQRMAPWPIAGVPWQGITTHATVLANAAGGTVADVGLVQAASGELLALRVESDGTVWVTEILLPADAPSPTLPTDTVLWEPRVEVDAIADGRPLPSASTARASSPAEDLVVGQAGPGQFIGAAGLREAIERLRVGGGTVRVRAGFYPVDEGFSLPSSVRIEMDPGAMLSAAGECPAVFLIEGDDVRIVAAGSGLWRKLDIQQDVRKAGYGPGSVLFNKMLGESRILEVGQDGWVRLSSALVNGPYSLRKNGICIRGGTILLAHSSSSAFSVRHSEGLLIDSVEVVTDGGNPTAFRTGGGLRDVIVTNCRLHLNSIGAVFGFSDPASRPMVASDGVRFSGNTIRNPYSIGEVRYCANFHFIDNVISGATVIAWGLELVTGVSGRISGNRGGSCALKIQAANTSRVTVDDNDWSSFEDGTRDAVSGNTDNKPSFSDALFKGNVYINGQLNDGQYDRALLALAMQLETEGVIELLGMLDAVWEDFITTDDLNTTTFSEVWAHPAAPLLLDFSPYTGQPVHMVGRSEIVRPQWFTSLFAQTRPSADRDSISTFSGGLRGLLQSIRGVPLPGPPSVAGSFTASGFPDRGKFEMVESFGVGAETQDLRGELTAAKYGLLDVVGSSEEGTLSSLRYQDNAGPLLVGAPASTPRAYRRTVAAAVFTDQNVAVVVSTDGQTIGGGWKTQPYVSFFRPGDGAHVLTAVVPELMIHWVGSGAPVLGDVGPLSELGEIEAASIIQDPSDATKAWLFMSVYAHTADGLTNNWRAQIVACHLDLSAASSATLYVSLGGAHPAWKALATSSVADVRWRSFGAVAMPVDFPNNIGSTENIILTWAESTVMIPPGSTETWTRKMGVFRSDTEALHVGAFTVPGAAAPTAWMNAEMSNYSELGTHAAANAAALSDGAPWQQRALAGLAYHDDGGGDSSIVFIYTTSTMLSNWLNSEMVAVRVSWTTGDDYDSPSTVDETAESFADSPDIPNGPYAIWDSVNEKFIVSWVEATSYGPGHTLDSVVYAIVDGSSGWTWDASPTEVRTLSSPLVKQFAAAGYARSGDAVMAMAWQGQESGGNADIWGYFEVDSGGNTVIAKRYETDGDYDTMQLSESGPASRSSAILAFGSHAWDAGSSLTTPPSVSASEVRDQFLLYPDDTWSKRLKLRIVGPKVAAKFELECPVNTPDILEGLIRCAGSTSSATGVENGVTGYLQDGFRALTTVVGDDPDNDTYDAAAPLFNNANGFPANWGAVANDALDMSSAAMTLRAAIPAKDVTTIPSLLWTVGANYIVWDDGAAEQIANDESFLSIKVGDVIRLDNAAPGKQDLTISFIGTDTGSGERRLVTDRPITLVPGGSADTVQIFKRVFGFVVLPDVTAGSRGNIVHPERVFVNGLSYTGFREGAAESVTSGIVTAPVTPTNSVVVLLQLQDMGGVLEADIAAGGADLADYIDVQVSRDNGATFASVTFPALDGTTNPLLTTTIPAALGFPVRSGYIVHGTYNFPVVSGVTNDDLVWRVQWVRDGSDLPGAQLYLDKITVGWN
jgi:hypothetical protein